MFTCCHPALSTEAQVALTLPEAHELPDRLRPALAVIYLV